MPAEKPGTGWGDTRTLGPDVAGPSASASPEGGTVQIRPAEPTFGTVMAPPDVKPVDTVIHLKEGRYVPEADK
ncbi:MAG: hypothetical protein ABFD90_07715 [Phycisphaerales bacterium]